MVRIAVAALLTLAVSVFAVGDPAGAANVGNGQGKQFITGGCTADADCASGCCAGLKDGAVCSAKDVANEQGKQGCGFGGAGGAGGGQKQNGNAGNAGKAGNAGNNGGGNKGAAVPDAAGSQNVGNGQGKQFITGACTSDADCASGCCAGKGDGAVCSARAVANEQGKQGCGFGGAGAGGAGGAGGKKQASNAANNGADANNSQNGNGQLCAREWTA